MTRRNLCKTQASGSDFINILNTQKLVQLTQAVQKHLTAWSLCTPRSKKSSCVGEHGRRIHRDLP